MVKRTAVCNLVYLYLSKHDYFSAFNLSEKKSPPVC